MKRNAVIVAVLIFVAIAVAVLFLTPARKIIFGSDAEAVRNAISAGKIEIASKGDIDRYFKYLPPDEINSLLNEHSGRGEFKFLMPQFDIDINAGPITVIEEKKSIEGIDVLYLTVRGLPLGSKIYSGLDGFTAGGYREDNDPPYAWISERVISEDAGTYADVLRTTYFPTIYIPGGAQALFLSRMDDVFRRADLLLPIAPLLTDRPLSDAIAPANSRIALTIEKEGKLMLADLDNILLSSDGKIVMVKR